MQCRNCSGNEFDKTSSGNFKCRYCGTLFYAEKRKHLSGIKLPVKTAVLVVFVFLFVTCLIIFTFRSCRDNQSGIAENPAENNYTFSNVENLPEPSAELESIDAIPDTIGNVYFLVMCRNSGKVAIRKPYVTIKLYSGKNVKVATGSGYGFSENLNPGEETPVYILVNKCPAYARYETEFTPELPYIIPEKGIFSSVFKAEISEVTMKPLSIQRSFKVRGKIINRCQAEAKYVQVAVVLYSKEGRAIGYGSTFINQKNLKPGDFDFFEADFYSLNGKPDYYKIYYYGSID